MFKVSDTIILPVSFCLWWKQKGKGGRGHMRLDMQALVNNSIIDFSVFLRWYNI
jgi:hypothetical protein